jgi:spermidine synthase
MQNYYEEDQPWGKTCYEVVPQSYMFMMTERAKVELFTNPYFGRMLFIDNVLQSATADEHLYHQPFASLGVGQRKQEKVLIAGSAEGALLRELQDIDSKYDLGVKEFVMVDWDKQLVEHMRDEEPWSRGSFDEPRLRLEFSDIEEFLEKDTNTYTSILLDLLDPQTKEEEEWLNKIIQISLTKLTEDGVLTFNAGRSEKWKGAKEIFVPSFQEVWKLVSLDRFGNIIPTHTISNKCNKTM